MHFWIDKRSQCVYNGRHRVPPSLSAGAGLGRGRGRGRKGMAAPVHRFAAVDCPPRRPHRARHTYGPPPTATVQSSRRQNEESSLYVEIPPEPPQPTIASLAAARSVTPDTLLRTAALGLHHTPMMAPHLKFGMFVSFALAAIFLAGAKYYFDRQVVREAGAVCVAVAGVCGVGCVLAVCRREPPAPPPEPERVSSTAQRDRYFTAQPAVEASPERGESGRGGRGAGGEAPPPYHIAVLLPAPSAPPPAYSALPS